MRNKLIACLLLTIVLFSPVSCRFASAENTPNVVESESEDVYGSGYSDSSLQTNENTPVESESEDVYVPDYSDSLLQPEHFENVDDWLQANIDGTDYLFECVEAEISDDSSTMVARYKAYNPRGETVYTLYIYLDKDISVGNYSSANYSSNESEPWISIRCNSLATYGTGGSYELNITYRSKDWLHYEGSFSAELGRDDLSDTLDGIEKRKRVNSMQISNAKFAFTLELD